MKSDHLLRGAVVLALAGIFSQPANAQWQRNSIGNRLSEQEARIRQGVASGQLTRSEAARLRERDLKIWFDAGRARISGGRMTTAERSRLEAKLNSASRSITNQRRDGQRRYPKESIGEQISEQEARIRQGVASGELTRAEAERLREKNLRIRFETGRARITGGRMTASERARLEAKLNRTSSDIYREKHDRQDRG